MTKDHRCTYLAGPMTGYPFFNYHLFDTVAERLRGMGWVVHNPVEMDDPAVRDAALANETGELDANGHIAGQTWGSILGKDIQYLADDCDSLMLLPGWVKSRGARLEAFAAINNGYKIYLYNELLITPISHNGVLIMLTDECKKGETWRRY